MDIFWGGKRRNELCESSTETNLGDNIHNSGKIIQSWTTESPRALSYVNTILAMVKDAPLGWWRIKAGLNLRKAMAVNSMRS